MKAISIVYGGSLSDEARGGYALSPVFGGACALELALSRAASFEGVEKTALLLTFNAHNGSFFEKCAEKARNSDVNPEIVLQKAWTVGLLLTTIAILGKDYDVIYFVWADTPFLDGELAAKIAARQIKYRAEYSYADGWPLGFAPECLTAQTAAILEKIAGPLAEDAPARDTLFAVLSRDINSFDIETELSPVDLRQHRLLFAADSKRNLLLCERFYTEVPNNTLNCDIAARLIAEKPELLRTLPAFFPVQVALPCPENAVENCRFCPYADYGAEIGKKCAQSGKTDAALFMSAAKFDELLTKIADFAGDAVIDVSLWGEIALHPDKIALIEACLAKKELSLVIETCGIGWNDAEIDEIAEKTAHADTRRGERLNGMAPISWIVSLDADDYGQGVSEISQKKIAFAQKLAEKFPKNVYVQAIRVKGEEEIEKIEKFYRFWKNEGSQNAAQNAAQNASKSTIGVIIQKYDDFAGALKPLRAADISPVNRAPCWHLLRDFPILCDGTALVCREDLAALLDALLAALAISLKNGGANVNSALIPVSLEGKQPKHDVNDAAYNVFARPLAEIWESMGEHYRAQCASGTKKSHYDGICGACDEYYTYNF